MQLSNVLIDLVIMVYLISQVFCPYCELRSEANKMLIISASSSLWKRKQLQDARFDIHFTVVKKQSFNWLTKTTAHDKGFTNSSC